MGDVTAMIRKSGFSCWPRHSWGSSRSRANRRRRRPFARRKTNTPGLRGYSPTEVNVESKSFQARHASAREPFSRPVSCKYGQSTRRHVGHAPCHAPGDPTSPITVQVTAQLKARQADAAVYARVAVMPIRTPATASALGYACEHLVDALGIPAQGQLAGRTASVTARNTSLPARRQLLANANTDGTITEAVAAQPRTAERRALVWRRSRGSSLARARVCVARGQCASRLPRGRSARARRSHVALVEVRTRGSASWTSGFGVSTLEADAFATRG